MQSIGAVYTATFAVRDLLREGQPPTQTIYVRYRLPQRRFAPLCLTCFLWSDTTLSFAFSGDAATKALASVAVLHAGPTYTPHRDKAASPACPQF